MEIREFAEKVRIAMEKKLGGNHQVELKEVRKNNGVILQGLLIMAKGQNIAPTIYLEAFWESYESGTAFAAIIRRLISIYMEETPGGRIDMDFFRCFDKVKDRICYRLIGRRGNEKLLEDVPHIEFLDLALCFYYAYQGEMLGEGSILIYNSHVEMWGICMAELVKCAQDNTPELFPWEYSSLESVLNEAAGGSHDNEELYKEVSIKVLSNRKKVQGAVCMIYPGVLEEIALREQSSFFILPSSVHEVLLLTDVGMEMAAELKKMIVEVNRTQVAPEEILSDSLYYYDFSIKKVKIIF